VCGAVVEDRWDRATLVGRCYCQQNGLEPAVACPHDTRLPHSVLRCGPCMLSMTRLGLGAAKLERSQMAWPRAWRAIETGIATAVERGGVVDIVFHLEALSHRAVAAAAWIRCEVAEVRIASLIVPTAIAMAFLAAGIVAKIVVAAPVAAGAIAHRAVPAVDH